MNTEANTKANTKAKAKWHYFGDLNLEHGGFFYSLEDVKWGYYDAVRVTPFSDAGGQDNGFWIEVGSINIPSVEKVEEALRSVGLTLSGDISDHEMACALESYGYFEAESTEGIQIGLDDPFHAGDWIPYSKKLRGNTDLESWVRRNYLT